MTGPRWSVALGGPDRSRRLLLASPLVVPWTVVPAGGAISLVFPWGLVRAWPPPVAAVPLSRYLLELTAGLPASLQAWPMNVVLYACALASTSDVVRPPFDDDGTAVLLAASGLAHVLVSVGVWRTGRVALPVGTIVLWVLAYWLYRGRVSRDGDGRGTEH